MSRRYWATILKSGLTKTCGMISTDLILYSLSTRSKLITKKMKFLYCHKFIIANNYILAI